MSGIPLEGEEPEDEWDEAASGIRLLEEAEEAKLGGVWHEADKNDVRKLAEDLQGIGIKDPGSLVTIGEQVRKPDATTRESDPEAILVDVLERKVGRHVVITLPGDDDDDDDDKPEKDMTSAIEGYVPKSRRA